MKDLKDLGLDGQFKHLDSTPQGDSKPASVMTLEVELEPGATKPQELRRIKPYVQSQAQIPTFMKPEAQIVMHALFECFGRQQEVKEGLIGDAIWGFGQAGIPPEASVRGFDELHKLGYVKFQAPDNTWIDFTSDKIEAAWVRYQPKLLEMVYEGSASI